MTPEFEQKIRLNQILNEQRGFNCDLESEESHSPYNPKRVNS